MPNQLHHVVIRSHSAATFIGFLTGVVGMTIQQQYRVPTEILESTLGWPPSEGADVTMLGNGAAGLIEVLCVPERIRDQVPEGLAALSFLTDDFAQSYEAAWAYASDVTLLEATPPGVEVFFCTAGNVAIEIMSSYVEDVGAQLC